jgi:3',5'-cyclic AMP phosphodiesterase CpdA
VRLLHISDLHLRATLAGTSDKPERLSRKAPELLARLAQRMREIAPDAIVVTGDLLDVPKPFLYGKITDMDLRAEITAAAISDYRYVADWMRSHGVPFVALPGNHDAYDLFYGVFGDDARELDVGGTRLVAFHDREHENNIPRRVGQEASHFQSALADDDERPQIHLQHFLIRPALALDYPYNYPDAQEMAAAIRTSGRVLAVLSGHYHKGAVLTDDSGVCYSTAQAFCIAPHPVRVLDVQERALQTNDLAFE